MSGLIYRDIITQIRRSFLGNIIPDILFFFMFLVLLGKYRFSPMTIVLLYLPTQTSIIPITLSGYYYPNPLFFSFKDYTGHSFFPYLSGSVRKI